MKVHDSRATQSMRVTTDGKNLVSHAGTALLSELADRSGPTEAMSVAMVGCGINWHTHDPGIVLTHLGVAIADGADCLADLASLREQSELFGPVASSRYRIPCALCSFATPPPHHRSLRPENSFVRDGSTRSVACGARLIEWTS